VQVARLDEATKIQMEDDIIYDGFIQRFELTFELSWKLMKMFLEYTGITEIKSPPRHDKRSIYIWLMKMENNGST
jgi:nucleotidyltransferase substrate binding protein (TIGR01987 family)